jgi:type I restriction enzyme S subunit
LTHIRTNNEIITSFIVYFFGTNYLSVLSKASTPDGGGQGNLNVKIVNRFLIPTPPLLEQQTIADYLDIKTAQIARKIDLLTQKASLYSKLKQSLINETVTRGLDKTVPMKDSGAEWIGEIPAHWQIKRIADIAIQNKVKNSGLIEKNLLSLSYGRIIRKDFNTSFGLLPESFETYQIVKTGSIILRLTDLQNDQKSLRVGLVREKGIITAAYLGLCFHRSINPIFAYYLLHVYDLCKVFYWFGGGLRSTMRFDDIKVIPFVLPPTIAEQQTIANYLDEKTAQIDQIIQTINSQIDKLKELRKALINDVVTGKIKITGTQ